MHIHHLSVVRPALRAQNALLAAHDCIIRSGSSGIKRVSSLEGTCCSQPARGMERAEGALRELDALSRTDRWSELSYAPAPPNRQRDGVVLTSIYSRTDTRTYAKAVQKFAPLVAASAEGFDAIEKARTPVSSK